MSLGSTVSDSASRTSVDSASPGSHDDASLSWTSASFALSGAMASAKKITIAATIHLVTGPVSLPAISACMGDSLPGGTDNVIGNCRDRLRPGQELIGTTKNTARRGVMETPRRAVV
jgi:hypothetical protein